jgi:stage II sporulation protein M
MKKVTDKFKITIKHNKKVIFFLGIIAVIAIIFGSLFSVMLNESDKNLTLEYINNFFENIKNNNLNYILALKNGSISSLGFILIVWLLGVSIIGMPIVLFMYFSKFFVIGFSISSIIKGYGLKGCLLSFAYIFPHHIIYIIVYTILTVYSIKMSIKLISTIIKKDKIDFKPIVNKYLLVLLLSVIIAVLTLLFEVFITPKFINLILLLVK